jgi:hypothetical protein
MFTFAPDARRASICCPGEAPSTAVAVNPSKGSKQGSTDDPHLD